MALSQKDAADVAARVIDRWPDKERHERIHRYVRGEHDLPFAPKHARAAYLWTLKRSRTNWCRLLVQLLSQNLIVDGYRATDPNSPAPAAWSHWVANSMGRYQAAVHRSALKYGLAFALVLPGEPSPVIRGYSPRRMTAVYADDRDEWPVYAVARSVSWTPSGPRTLYRLIDDQAVYDLAEDDTGLAYISHQEHGLGLCPVVSFVDEEDLDGDSPGVVEPILDVQDRLNYSTFLLMQSGEHGAHRQRWAAGLELDEETEPAIGPDRLLHSDSAETRFGTFEHTDLRGYIDALEQILRHLAALTQTPPHALHGSLTNLAADALDAAESGLQRRVGERRTSYGESWAQVLRLCALVAGDAEGWRDLAAHVHWRETQNRSLSAVMDAWGKAVTMLEIPPRAAWERIPGVTDTDVARWSQMPASLDGHALLAETLTRHTEASTTEGGNPFDGNQSSGSPGDPGPPP
ncbi:MULTISPECIES: phage portal protein [unclassified Crossiella]|uniref:phage portal protein n=1 Tax=unclassified Crossiella TaxID=2620835 RepID=UPI001FFFA702|nr:MULTISPECIES: phage portal protein [unclassified Crossiella]MCK2239391.1 phage portal protein [Crossiella sp. S99.2]MCK2252086.1 phage portal protein [Crossiella sp. S99.1]